MKALDQLRVSCAAPLLTATLLTAAVFCGCAEREPTEAGAPPPAAAVRTLHVAAASDLQPALETLLRAFREQHPDLQVVVAYGSSGSLAAQLEQDAPFDLFLAADRGYPQRVIAAGKAAAEDEFVYAIGHVVLWSPTGSNCDVARGLEALRDPAVRKIAIADPQVAPYGRAAVAVLEHYGLLEEVEARLVRGENVSQAAQFAASGAADAALISLSQARGPKLDGRGAFWQVPSEAHPVLEQGGVILSRAADRAAAEALRAFLLGPVGGELLVRFGFDLPGK